MMQSNAKRYHLLMRPLPTSVHKERHARIVMKCKSSAQFNATQGIIASLESLITILCISNCNDFAMEILSIYWLTFSAFWIDSFSAIPFYYYFWFASFCSRDKLSQDVTHTRATSDSKLETNFDFVIGKSTYFGHNVMPICFGHYRMFLP